MIRKKYKLNQLCGVIIYALTKHTFSSKFFSWWPVAQTNEKDKSKLSKPGRLPCRPHSSNQDSAHRGGRTGRCIGPLHISTATRSSRHSFCDNCPPVLCPRRCCLLHPRERCLLPPSHMFAWKPPDGLCRAAALHGIIVGDRTWQRPTPSNRSDANGRRSQKYHGAH